MVYLRGLLAASGAGRPPHSDEKCTIRPPSACTCVRGVISTMSNVSTEPSSLSDFYYNLVKEEAPRAAQTGEPMDAGQSSQSQRPHRGTTSPRHVTTMQPPCAHRMAGKMGSTGCRHSVYRRRHTTCSACYRCVYRRHHTTCSACYRCVYRRHHTTCSACCAYLINDFHRTHMVHTRVKAHLAQDLHTRSLRSTVQRTHVLLPSIASQRHQFKQRFI